jgi:hypothetical protein
MPETTSDDGDSLVIKDVFTASSAWNETEDRQPATANPARPQQ